MQLHRRCRPRCQDYSRRAWYREQRSCQLLLSKTWPQDREQRERIIGDWLKAEVGMTGPRRFPSPWSADNNGACFIVKDHNGQALAYVYYEEDPGRRAAANLLTREEARRIAVNIANLPELLQRPRY